MEKLTVEQTEWLITVRGVMVYLNPERIHRRSKDGKITAFSWTRDWLIGSINRILHDNSYRLTDKSWLKVLRDWYINEVIRIKQKEYIT